MLRRILINSLKVTLVGSSLYATQLILAQEKLYAWGWNNFGQLGLGHSNSVYIPQEVPLSEVAMVVAQSCVSAAIDKSGRLYTWGRSKFGLLGNGHTDNINVPTLVESLKELKFKHVACSNYHMGAITIDGELYTWGNSEHGKLGHSYSSDSKIPSREKYEFQQNLGSVKLPEIVNLSFKAKQVAMGDQFTIVLSEEGEVWVAGVNRKGVLGIDTKNISEAQFVKIDSLSNIVKIDSGVDFSIALDNKGNLFAWGSNYFGQMGSPSPFVFQKPQLIHGLPKIKEFSCGGQFVGALSEGGTLYTWGYGGDGQLGSSTKSDIPSPHEVKLDQIVSAVSCGVGHIGIIQATKLYMFGRGKEGQLGRGSNSESPTGSRFSPLLVLPNVTKVACGGQHTFAIVDQ